MTDNYKSPSRQGYWEFALLLVFSLVGIPILVIGILILFVEIAYLLDLVPPF